MKLQLCLVVSSVALISLGCYKKYSLKNTSWRVVQFSIDSNNYLSDVDREAYAAFDTSTILNADFGDSLVFTYVQGSVVDTSSYFIHGDTLFFVQGFKRDTTLILKLTNDSLVDYRLSGVTTRSRRVNKK